MGVRELLELAVQLLPGPEKREVKGKDLHGQRDAAARRAGRALRRAGVQDHHRPLRRARRLRPGLLRHAQAGRRSLMNPRTRTEERVAHFYRTDGAQTAEVQEAGPGDFVVLMKLKDAHTGDTLCDRDAPVVLPAVPRSHNRPVAYAVHAKTGDDKAAAALHKLIEEDPSLELARSPDTGEMLLQGMGQAHIEVTVERVKRKHGVEITLAPPIAGLPRDHHRAVQGAGQVQAPDRRPRPVRRRARRALPEGRAARGSSSRTRSSAAPSRASSSPRSRRASAARSAPGRSPATRWWTSRRSSSSAATTTSTAPTWRSRSPGSMAFKKAVIEARPILLEPVMKLEVRVPEEYVGRGHGRPEQPPRQGAGAWSRSRAASSSARSARTPRR